MSKDVELFWGEEKWHQLEIPTSRLFSHVPAGAQLKGALHSPPEHSSASQIEAFVSYLLILSKTLFLIQTSD